MDETSPIRRAARNLFQVVRIILPLALAILGAQWLYERWHIYDLYKRKGISHARGYTGNDISALCELLDEHLNDSEDRVSSSLSRALEIQTVTAAENERSRALLKASHGEIEPGRLFWILQKDPGINHSMLEMQGHWLQSKRLTDNWGNDLHIQYRLIKATRGTVISTNSYLIKVWSNGPNRSNENGDGDDIKREFIFDCLTKSP